VEEPIFEADGPRLVIEPRPGGVTVVRPVVPPGQSEGDVNATVAALVGDLARTREIREPVVWTWTPMAMPWLARLPASLLIYDCMDELSAFRFAPARILELEQRLFEASHLVFTGGRSLFEAKRGRHAAVHCFPSAVDARHFAVARRPLPEPTEQGALGRPRIGWFGVIDERSDLDLLAAVADRRPDWSFVLIGPTAKIDPASLPGRPNLHFVGPRPYAELPAWIAGWDVAMMPFARNASTRYISPTKTLEYLAAGRPIVSTSIPDVVEPFERLGLVRIADDADGFVAAIEAALRDDPDAVLAAADAYLAGCDWDITWQAMSDLIATALQGAGWRQAVPGPRWRPQRTEASVRALASRVR
jgi:UDP-galactopyranose mutase